MTDRVIELTAGEVAAMAHRVEELEDYQHELLRDSQMHIDDLVSQLHRQISETSVWRRRHKTLGRALMLYGVANVVLLVWGWLR